MEKVLTDTTARDIATMKATLLANAEAATPWHDAM